MSKQYLSLLILILLLFSCKSEKKENRHLSIDPGLEAYHKLIDAEPKNDTLYFERATYLYEQNKFTDAIQDLKKAIDINPEVGVYYNLLSDAYYEIYAYDESIIALKSLLKLAPDETAIQLKLAELQWIAGEIDNAYQTLDSIIIIKPDNAEAYFLQGLIAMDELDSLSAEMSFLKTLKVDRNHTEALMLMGKIYESKDPEKALAYLNQAINLDRENTEALNARAGFYMREGNLNSAMVEYRNIISKDKFNSEAFKNMGIIYMQMDSLQMALDNFNILLQIDIENGVGYYYRGLCNKQLGNKASSIEDFKQALHFIPDWEEPQEELTQLLEQ